MCNLKQELFHIKIGILLSQIKEFFVCGSIAKSRAPIALWGRGLIFQNIFHKYCNFPCSFLASAPFFSILPQQFCKFIEFERFEMHLSRALARNLNTRHWNRRVWEVGYRGPVLPQQKAWASRNLHFLLTIIDFSAQAARIIQLPRIELIFFEKGSLESKL